MMQGSSFRLIVRRGPQPNQVYTLDKDIVTIGRDITNDIVVNDPEVSRHHCRLTRGPMGYTMEDLGSTNGTFVNGQRVTAPRPLSNGDLIGLGETVTLAYEASMAGGAEAATLAAGMEAPIPPSPAMQPQPQVADIPTPQQYGAPVGAPAQQPAPSPGVYSPYYAQAEPQKSGWGVEQWALAGFGCLVVLCIITVVVAAVVILVTNPSMMNFIR